MAKRSGYSQQYFANRRAAMRNGTFIGSTARAKRNRSRGMVPITPKTRKPRAKNTQSVTMGNVAGISVPVPSNFKAQTINRIRALPDGEQAIAVAAAIKSQARAAAHHARKAAANAANNPPPGGTTAAPPTNGPTTPPPAPRRGIRSRGEATEPPTQPTSRTDRRAAAAATGRTIGPATAMPPAQAPTATAPTGVDATGLPGGTIAPGGRRAATAAPPDNTGAAPASTPAALTPQQRNVDQDGLAQPNRLAVSTPLGADPRNWWHGGVKGQDYIDYQKAGENPQTLFRTKPEFSNTVDMSEIKGYFTNGRKFEDFSQGARKVAQLMGTNIAGVVRETTKEQNTVGSYGTFFHSNRAVYLNKDRSERLEKAFTTGDFSDPETQKSLKTLVHEFTHGKDPVLLNGAVNDDAITAIRANNRQYEMMIEGPIEYQARQFTSSMLGTTVPSTSYEDATNGTAVFVKHAGKAAFDDVFNENVLGNRLAKFNNHFGDTIKKTLTDIGFTQKQADTYEASMHDNWADALHVQNKGLEVMLNTSAQRQAEKAAGNHMPGGMSDAKFRNYAGKYFNAIFAAHGKRDGTLTTLPQGIM